jgi:hypothetical protein
MNAEQRAERVMPKKIKIEVEGKPVYVDMTEWQDDIAKAIREAEQAQRERDAAIAYGSEGAKAAAMAIRNQEQP